MKKGHLKFVCIKEIFKYQIKDFLIDSNQYPNCTLISLNLLIINQSGINTSYFLNSLTKSLFGLLMIKVDDYSKPKNQFEAEFCETIRNLLMRETILFETKIFCLIYMLMDFFTNYNPSNYGRKHLFDNLYSDDNKRNIETLRFFEMTTQNITTSYIFIKNNNNILIEIMNIFCDDLIRKMQMKDSNSKDHLFLIHNSIKNCLFFLKFLNISTIEVKIGDSDAEVLNKLICVFLYYAANDRQIRADLIEGKVLNLLMGVRNYDPEGFNKMLSLESLFKLLEVLCFDKEYVFYNVGQEILQVFL